MYATAVVNRIVVADYINKNSRPASNDGVNSSPSFLFFFFFFLSSLPMLSPSPKGTLNTTVTAKQVRQHTMNDINMFFAVVFPIDLLPVFGPGLFDFVRFERVA
jgi:hypothetical protein